MKNKDLIESIKEDLSKFKEKGNEVVEIDSLITYLTSSFQDQMNDPNSLDISATAEIKKMRDHYSNYQWRKEPDSEMFQSVITMAQNALKSCMLIHAGACVILLAFMGNLVSNSETRAMIPAFADTILWFLVGVLLASISYATTYFTQYFYHHNKEKLGNFLRCLTILFVIIIHGLFFIGGSCAYLAIKGII